MPPSVTVRRAGPDDVEALVRLRRIMLAAMGDDVGPDPAVTGEPTPWEVAARSWFAGGLTDPTRFAAFVVDDADGAVVAGAVGRCEVGPPGPGNHEGVGGHLFNVATAPDARRRGFARACVRAVLDWFDHETPARVVRLNATPDGLELYRGQGFADPAMRPLFRPSPAPHSP